MIYGPGPSSLEPIATSFEFRGALGDTFRICQTRAMPNVSNPQIVGVLFAGYETIANVIGDCLYEVSR
ncbi:hypothetical protein AcW1_002547 [Taiwanofungus camphoratus]|nr:hypothetical protein AcW1_002547 [Antrodia cinnamomea]